MNRTHLRSALIAFFRFVNAQGWRPDNPAEKLPKVKIRRGIPRPIANNDARRLLDVAEAMDAMVCAMVHIFIYCGLRNAELRALQWADVGDRMLAVVDGKGGKERNVPIAEPAWVALMRWRLDSNSAEWVFHAARNPAKPMAASTLAYCLDELIDAAGLEHVTPHELRHTYATELLAVSGDITVVQAGLGHASPSTSAIYARVNPAKLAAASKRLYGQGDGENEDSPVEPTGQQPGQGDESEQRGNEPPLGGPAGVPEDRHDEEEPEPEGGRAGHLEDGPRVSV